MSTTEIELKGGQFNAFVMTLTDRDYAALSDALQAKVAQAPKFLTGASVVVHVEDEDGVDFAALQKAITDAQLCLVGITGGTEQQKAASKAAHIAVLSRVQRVSTPAVDTPPPSTVISQPTPTTKIVKNHVRSGQQVYAKDANLVILGTVSPGAEVIADGSIHVYGRLRGRAIAGANGNTEAGIYVQDLEAELVSVAGQYWLSDALQDKGWRTAVCISLADEQLVASSI